MFALDTLLALHSGEPVPYYLPILPLGKMRDDFEEYQEWALYTDHAGILSLEKFAPLRTYTFIAYMAQIDTYRLFMTILHTSFLDGSGPNAKSIQSRLWSLQAPLPAPLVVLNLPMPASRQSPLITSVYIGC